MYTKKTWSILCLTFILTLAFAFPGRVYAIQYQEPGSIIPIASVHVVKAWIDRFSDSKEWADLKNLKESEGLKTEVLLSLTILYIMDADTALRPNMMLDYEPRITIEYAGEGLEWHVNLMTHNGDIAIVIDAKTGELISSQADSSGGNG